MFVYSVTVNCVYFSVKVFMSYDLSYRDVIF